MMKILSRNIFCFSRFTHHASRITLCLLLAAFAGSTTLAQRSDDKQATFFMGRVKYSSNDGNDCGGGGEGFVGFVVRAPTPQNQEEGKGKLTHAGPFEKPLFFMNGHNDFLFFETQPVNLFKKLRH